MRAYECSHVKDFGDIDHTDEIICGLIENTIAIVKDNESKKAKN